MSLDISNVCILLISFGGIGYWLHGFNCFRCFDFSVPGHGQTSVPNYLQLQQLQAIFILKYNRITAKNKEVILQNRELTKVLKKHQDKYLILFYKPNNDNTREGNGKVDPGEII